MSRVTQLITLSIPPEMDEKIRELMKKENRTRSELIREAIRRYIEEKEWEEIYRYGEKKAIEKGITEDQVEDIIDARRK
ncbi:MAG TPA: ribbon-helix-helix domain-containing protein [bacterium]|nr:ribbon-helix-helix protein, CopG family [Dictyoglomota bacterium]HON72940.1 ribbon-helix-helix domain-containing protein [bacterium]